MSSPSPALSDALNPSNVVQIRRSVTTRPSLFFKDFFFFDFLVVFMIHCCSRHLEGVLEQRCDANKMFAHSASETDDAALQDFSLHVKVGSLPFCFCWSGVKSIVNVDVVVFSVLVSPVGIEVG